MTETITSRDVVVTLAQGHDDDDMHFTADVLLALLARAEKAEADKVAAHRQGYAQGKAAGDAFGASLKGHVKRLEAERDTAWSDAIEAAADEVTNWHSCDGECVRSLKKGDAP